MNKHLRVPSVVPETPSWAGGYGTDGYGIFADLVIGEVVQRLRWIEPGTFKMGSPDDESPQHDVRISQGFWLGEGPVTQAFYEALTGENPSEFKGGEEDASGRPVEQLSWNDCKAFCERLTAMLPEPRDHSVRLPTEAEWEYACRAGTTTATAFGDSLSSRQANFDGNYPLGNAEKGPYLQRTSQVGKYPPNAWGLHDMHGNVWEWCDDGIREYTEEHQVDPRGPEDGAGRVVRGGCWIFIARFCRSAYRNWFEPGYRNFSLGFRLVLARGSEDIPDHSP